MTIAKKLLLKIFQIIGYQISRATPKELDYETFIKKPDILDKFITRINSPEDLCFYSSPKLIGLQKVFEEYLKTLLFNFDFKIKPDDIVIDIGAHHGIVGLNFARLGAQVIAYEPNPINFEILKRNKKWNPTFNIEIENKAVSSKNQVLEFNLGKTSTTGSLSKSQRNWKNSELKTNVNAISYLELFKTHKLANVKLMKIDIEGGEYDFLLGVPKELVRKVQYFYIEVHPTKTHNPIIIKDFLIKNGYEVFGKTAAHDCF